MIGALPTRIGSISREKCSIGILEEAGTMLGRRGGYEYEDVLASGRGELFGAGNAQLPLPPMLMFDRITEISENGGEYGKGVVRAELDVKPDLWFFGCHFKGGPVMPGCLGLDALWQMVGFYLVWTGGEGRGRALGLGELKRSGQVMPNVRKIVYNVDIKRVMRLKLVLGVADGWLSADDEIIYRAKDLKVGLFKQDAALQSEGEVTCSGQRRGFRFDNGRHTKRKRQGEAIMRRVVITGMGIVSSIGNNTQEVLASLHEAKSGITRAVKYAELGFRSQVQGAPTLDPAGVIDRRAMRFLGEGAAWNHVAMEQAIQDSGLEPAEVSNVRTGIIMGSGGPSARTLVEAADITRAKGPKRVGPFAVPKAMSSTASATLATWFKIKGVNYSISSACATSNHCIGNAYETIQIGKQDVIFAGGCEELDWTLSVLFDAMGAMSSKYNDTPATASRPYDVSRDGFVIAGGAGVVVLEELEHAQARGARIYGEIVGYGATSDGYDMVAPSGEGAERCMKMAMATVDTKIDYINPHATSTPAGDPPEIEAIRKVFGTGDKCPPISATKALTGHSLGATGVQEAIYSLLMMNNGFICESANITELDPVFADMPIVRKRIDNAKLGTVLSNSFGFGGTNATLVFKRMDA